jgi:DNA (cytosine-5)-methyltransferase 1
MNFGSLFSGIGGLDLGLERAGFKCQWQSEINPYASRVLKKHWPDTPNLGDINDIDWRTVPTVNLVCGGYPCQPFSYAGSRNGTNDPRHLWPMFADCLRVVRPRFALLENVTGHLSLGFGDVQANLASIGYDTQWDCIPAAALGAPHLRDRIFVIATRNDGMDTNSDSEPNGTINAPTQPWPTPMADTNNERQKSRTSESQRWYQSRNGRASMAHTSSERSQRCWDEGSIADNSLAVRRLWEPEPRVGRVANGIPNRVDRLRGLGNAVVPQVAEHIGNIIKAMA